MKSQIESLELVAKEYEKRKSELDSQVREFAKEYVKYAKLKNPGSWNYPTDGLIDSWDFNTSDNQIDCKWEEYWSYGGHAEGSFSFPSYYLYNQESFNQFKNECEDAAVKIKVDKQNSELAQKQREFERLKKELGKE